MSKWAMDNAIHMNWTSRLVFRLVGCEKRIIKNREKIKKGNIRKEEAEIRGNMKRKRKESSGKMRKGRDKKIGKNT